MSNEARPSVVPAHQSAGSVLTPLPRPLSPLAKTLFPAVDSNLLKFLFDDNQKVEPEWYIPIIPMVLVNGAEGIGTGWACKIPNYNVREIVNNINRMLNHQEPLPLVGRALLSLSRSPPGGWMRESARFDTYVSRLFSRLISPTICFI